VISHRILFAEGGFVQSRLLLFDPLILFLHIFQWIGTLKGLVNIQLPYILLIADDLSDRLSDEASEKR